MTTDPTSVREAKASVLPAADATDARARLVAAARSCVGTPFLHQGRVRGIGLDCAGLVLYAAADAGLPYRDYPGLNYPRWPTMGDRLRRFVAEQTVEVPVERARDGTVLLLWCYRPTLPQHLALVTGPDSIVHSWYDARAVVETTLAGWRDRIVGAYDFIGVD